MALLFLHEALRNELIDRRFDEPRRDALATSWCEAIVSIHAKSDSSPNQ
jgi:hypothetical protein